MNFYDIAEEGFDTPLTSTQVSELFHAGRLDRSSACRLCGKLQWRTLDELFPLLKYDTSARLRSPSSDQPRRSAFSRREIAFAFAGAVFGVLAIGIYFGKADRPMPLPPKAVAPFGATSRPKNSVPPARASFPAQPIATSVPSDKPNTFPSGLIPQPRQLPARAMEDSKRRLEREQQNKEQLERDQTALADRLRNEQRAKDEGRERAKSTDHIVPLDSYSAVPVGSSTVRVKIHDNDVTSFDVWINGARRHEVRKEKGITASGTDETLIYSSGNARLYYVWEISGELNHCRLRVRDS